MLKKLVLVILIKKIRFLAHNINSGRISVQLLKFRRG